MREHSLFFYSDPYVLRLESHWVTLLSRFDSSVLFFLFSFRNPLHPNYRCINLSNHAMHSLSKRLIYITIVLLLSHLTLCYCGKADVYADAERRRAAITPEELAKSLAENTMSVKGEERVRKHRHSIRAAIAVIRVAVVLASSHSPPHSCISSPIVLLFVFRSSFFSTDADLLPTRPAPKQYTPSGEPEFGLLMSPGLGKGCNLKRFPNLQQFLKEDAKY